MKKLLPSRPKVLGVLPLSFINLAIFGLLHNWSLIAQYGVATFVFFLIVILVFFIPSVCVTAELASSFRHEGGIYTWIQEAFGSKAAFTISWLLWIQIIVWTPIPLMWVGYSLSFAFIPAWLTNSFFHLMVSIILLWGMTFLVLQGVKWLKYLTAYGLLLGSFLPGILIIVLGFLWLAQGKAVTIDFSFTHFTQEMGKLSNWILFPSIFVIPLGIEISAFYSPEVPNPKKTFPRAIALSSLIFIVFSILGSLAIAMFIPKRETLFFETTLNAISTLFHSFHLSWFFPIFAVMICIDVLVSLTNWQAAPPRGLHRVAKQGDLPPSFRHINAHHMPSSIIVFQGVIISFIISLYILFPDITTIYWILVSLTIIFHLIIYLFLFAAVIKLRYKKPEIERPYKIPGGKFGLWSISGLGFLSCAVTLVLGFILPQRILDLDPLNYFLLIGVGIMVICLVPWFIHLFKKPQWNIPDVEGTEEKD